MRRANNDNQRRQWGFEYQNAYKAGQVAQMGLLSLVLTLVVVGAVATISDGFKKALSQLFANLF